MEKRSEKENELERLREKLEACREEKKKYLNGWKRARADLANYKKEEAERRERFLKISLSEFLLRLLPVLDSFDRAEESLPEKIRKREEVKGLLKIRSQFESFLEKEGMEEIKVAGEMFDPAVSEAVGETKEGEPGRVAEVVEKGYRIEERVLRPAKVIVGKDKEEGEQKKE